MFRKILVANRGEIAERIFMACRELGVRSVAVYSEADQDSPWARVADESYLLPGSASSDSYLNQQAIFSIAETCGADAIHPGYGFLSENADFAEACAAHGVEFIGPSPAAIRIMGSKTAARVLAQRAGVPVVPGVDGSDRKDSELATTATAIGYPVLVKASAGGGGKGMRVVWSEEEFPAAVRAARSEALSSFGSDHILVEKYFTEVHHVEIQVIGDSYGNLLHLFERECSIQRRHQKIIEECPAPIMSILHNGRQICEAMAKAAVSLAREVHYVGVGTVEFVVDASQAGRDCFYLLEMNTRLQVEHPVTELVTGIDLVTWQIRIAAGERLPFTQRTLSKRGHAIECRVCAEDPSKQFLPSIGHIIHYQPPSGPGVRVDDGIATGTCISPHYDPMIAKVITWGQNRSDAIDKMIRALRDTVVLGVTTNIPYLLDIMDERTFRDGHTSTHYLQEHMADWKPRNQPSESDFLAIAALEAMQVKDRKGWLAPDATELREELPDPWDDASTWRNVT